MLTIPDLGTFPDDSGLVPIEASSDRSFAVGRDGVRAIIATGDHKVEFVCWERHALALVGSALGYPAYYPVRPVSVDRPVGAVLMDLDGTSVRSEHFWVWIIERATASLIGDPGFELDATDLPYVSGHSVSEHLEYCVRKYAPSHTLETARQHYFEHTHREMGEILSGRGRIDAFVPAPGLKDFLLELKARRIRVALVTSGLYEKAYPEILAAFRLLGLGDPASFYDAIITAGFPLRKGEVGTLGELSPKPHPWLYAEAFRIGLGMPFAERGRAVGVEDSAAGVCALRLAGFAPIGVGGGNIDESGVRPLCHDYRPDLAGVLGAIT